MKTLVKSFVGVLCLLAFAVSSAGALTVDFYVNSKDQPWSPGLNPTFNYGFPGDNPLPPTIVDSHSGFFFTPGDTLTISYVDGFTSPYGGSGWTYGDANGLNGVFSNGNKYPTKTDTLDFIGLGIYPTRWTPIAPGETYYLACLLGTFTDSTGTIVVGSKPFFIGDGPLSITIPSGATQLQLGINDDLLQDNRGILEVSVSGPGRPLVCPTPLPSAIILFGSGLLGLIGLTRKFQA